MHSYLGLSQQRRGYRDFGGLSSALWGGWRGEEGLSSLHLHSGALGIPIRVGITERYGL